MNKGRLAPKKHGNELKWGREGKSKPERHQENPKAGLHTCTQQHINISDNKDKKIVITLARAQMTGIHLCQDELKRNRKEKGNRARKA